MIKKKMAALLAVVLILVMVFPATAFAYAPESEQTSAATETEPAKTEEASEPENDDSEESPDGLESFLSDPDLLRVLLAGTDPEILEVLKEHPKLITADSHAAYHRYGRFRGDLHRQAGSEDPAGRHCDHRGSNLNVRTGPSTGYSIIAQLTGSTVNVIGEKDGWYEIELPARYGYVCGQYLK